MPTLFSKFMESPTEKGVAGCPGRGLFEFIDGPWRAEPLTNPHRPLYFSSSKQRRQIAKEDIKLFAKAQKKATSNASLLRWIATRNRYAPTQSSDCCTVAIVETPEIFPHCLPRDMVVVCGLHANVAWVL